MALWAVGAVINIIGSIMINLGTNVIKLGHTKTTVAISGDQLPPKMTKAPRRWWHFSGNRVWLGGMVLFTVGNLLNFASFAFAAQSLLSALGVVQFISNIAFGRWMNKEKVTKRVLFATAVICLGCILLVVFGNHESPTLSTHDMLELYTKPLYIFYLCFIFTMSPAMYLVYRVGKRAILADYSGAAVRRWARWLPICYALFAGLLGTQSVLYGKTISMLLRTTIGGGSQLGSWYTWVSVLLFVLFAGFWMNRYSKAMKLFPVLIIMPTIQIVWVLFSMISGSLYYQEYKTLNVLSGTMFGLGVVILLAGVWLLTGGNTAMAQPPLELKVELTEEEVTRAGDMDGEALRSKAPLSDNLEAVSGAALVSAAQLAPEDALVARKLSIMYDRQALSGARLGSISAARGGCMSGHHLQSGGKHCGREEVDATEESWVQLVEVVEGGPYDSADAWPASTETEDGLQDVASGGGCGGGKTLSEVVTSPPRSQGGSGELAWTSRGESVPSGGGAASGGGGVPGGSLPLHPSLMHDLRADWGVGMRDVAAVMRASVGMRADDEEMAAFSIWSMPMPCSSSFTSQRRSLDIPLRAQRPTFRVRTVLEAAAVAGGGRGGSAHPGNADDKLAHGEVRPRQGHRRLNRSRSANELDEVLMSISLNSTAGEVETELRARSGAPSGGIESPWCTTSSFTVAASGFTPPPLPEAAPGLRPHPSVGSAPVLGSVLVGSITPAAGRVNLQMLSLAGSGARRTWSPESPSGGGSPTSPRPLGVRSPGSEMGESEGHVGIHPSPTAQQEQPTACKGDKAA